MKECEIFCLLERLIRLGAMDKSILVRTNDFGMMMGTSQQTASRKLVQLEREGFIKRTVLRSGTRIRLTGKGLAFIENKFKEFKNFENYFSSITFSGKVTAGMGEGSYYMSRSGYIDQFRNIFNEIPYPGTFNVIVDDETMEKLSFIRERAKYVLAGFTQNGRTFGNVYVHRARVNGIDAYAIFPERGHYKNVVEIVAAENLRKKLNLRDGDTVSIEIYPEFK